MKSSILLPALATALLALPLQGFSQDGADPEAAAASQASYSPDLDSSEGPLTLASFMGSVVGIDPANPYTAEDVSCYGACCGACTDCCRSHDVWGGAEYFLWWGKGSNTPALVTTSPDGTAFPDIGRLDGPGVRVIAGNELLGKDVQSGGRLTFGVWLDPFHNVGVGGKVYGLEGDDTNRTFGFSDGSGGPGNPILARPFFNALLGVQDAFPIAFPGVAAGSVNVSSGNTMIAAESYLRIMLEREQNHRIDLIAGYHFMRFDDRLSITSNSVNNGFAFDVADRFSTENEFHGGQLGLQGEMMRGRWSLNGLAKVSYGNVRQEVSIDGSTTVNGAPLNGGLLAQPTNIGTFTRNRDMFIPELGVNLVFHRTQNIRFSFGYNIIWMTNVVTSGDQIDFQVNASQLTGPLVGPARPQFQFQDTDYWFQGLNFGVQWDF